MFRRYATILREETGDAPEGGGQSSPPATPAGRGEPPKEAAKTDDRSDGFSAAFRALQQEVAGHKSEIGKRDRTIAELQKQLAERDGKVAELTGQIETLDKRGREVDFMSKLRAKVPHVSDLVLGGVVDRLHAAQKIDKYATDEQRDAQIEAALAQIKDVPEFAKPPAFGGGSNGVPQKPEKPAGTRGFWNPVKWQ